MKKLMLLSFIFLMLMLSFSRCSKTKSTLNADKKVDYTAFMKDLNANKDTNEILEFSLRDLDNNGIPELVINKNGVNITVYTFNDSVIEVGKRNFETGTTRLLFSDNSLYPGILYFYACGGLNHYGYLTIKENKLIDEELWNEDYSGISKELGIKRKKIKELSTDKQLINESKTAYKENSNLPFEKLQPIKKKSKNQRK